jgi:hypothetical protein
MRILDIQRSAEMEGRKEEDEQIENFKREHERDKKALFDKVKAEYKRRLETLTLKYGKDDTVGDVTQ